MLCFPVPHFFPHSIQEPPQDLHPGVIANSLLIHGTSAAIISMCTHHSSIVLCLQILHSLYVPDLPCNFISPQWPTATLQKQNKKVFPSEFSLIAVSSYMKTTSFPYPITPHLNYLFIHYFLCNEIMYYSHLFL